MPGQLVSFFFDHPCDYAYNHVPIDNTWPNGLGAEICNTEFLQHIDRLASRPEHREHIFSYVWDHRTQFDIKTFNPHLDLAGPEIRLDLDDIEDYKWLCETKFHAGMSDREIVKLALSARSNI